MVSGVLVLVVLLSSASKSEGRMQEMECRDDISASAVSNLKKEKVKRVSLCVDVLVVFSIVCKMKTVISLVCVLLSPMKVKIFCIA